MDKELGRRMQRLMSDKGISRKELCEKTHLTEAALSRYITGQREPRAITLASIARALDVSVDDLLGTKCSDASTLEGAVTIVARNASDIPDEQKKWLIGELLNL